MPLKLRFYQNFTGSRGPVHIILDNKLTLNALICKFLLLLPRWPELNHSRFGRRSLDGCQRVCRFCVQREEAVFVQGLQSTAHVLQSASELWTGMTKRVSYSPPVHCLLSSRKKGVAQLTTPAHSSTLDEEPTHCAGRLS